ncbi:MAG: Dam family site-specific DNA-(adenine-N6)-methyltransferase [Treponema sp.]|jgi:DNA adenine methylase|nr:Dam family site-specific DNA-(adenine-N6)-methyltransferase [Treponema sp.]
MVKNNSIIKPFLKWVGGKRQLLAVIKKSLPKVINNYIYYEPFIGAGALFFELQPQKAVINDYNEQLILTYNVIKEKVGDLVILLKEYQKKNDKEYYYEIRNTDRDLVKFNTLTNIEKAARLIFLNKTCFNGLYRVNSKGFFNVPYGKYKNPAICEEILLQQISNYLNSNKINIINSDFEQAVSTADKKSFIYFDPPYHSPYKNNFTGYQANGFNDSEQERLCNVMIKMTNLGVKCLLSNSDTEYIRELYAHNFFEIVSVQAKRAINSDSAGRGTVNEVLIKNWKD